MKNGVVQQWRMEGGVMIVIVDDGGQKTFFLFLKMSLAFRCKSADTHTHTHTHTKGQTDI